MPAIFSRLFYLSRSTDLQGSFAEARRGAPALREHQATQPIESSFKYATKKLYRVSKKYAEILNGVFPTIIVPKIFPPPPSKIGSLCPY